MLSVDSIMIQTPAQNYNQNPLNVLFVKALIQPAREVVLYIKNLNIKLSRLWDHVSLKLQRYSVKRRS